MSIRSGRSSSRPIYISSIPRERVTSVLRVGQVLRGTVIEQLADDLYIINFRGFNLNSRAQKKLQRGKNIYVRVTEIGEQIVMRLLPKEEYHEAQDEANLDELDSCLESIGIAPSHLNRLIASSMLRFHLPLSRDSFDDILKSAAKLKLDDENDIRSLVFLAARDYPRKRENIELVRYMDFPDESILLGKLVKMKERKLDKGDGLPVRVFDDEERSGICFRYRGDNISTVGVIAIIDNTEVETEFIVEDTKSEALFASNKTGLEERLREGGFDLNNLSAILKETPNQWHWNQNSKRPIGIDFRI
jgi:hypothetical protein